MIYTYYGNHFIKNHQTATAYLHKNRDISHIFIDRKGSKFSENVPGKQNFEASEIFSNYTVCVQQKKS